MCQKNKVNQAVANSMFILTNSCITEYYQLFLHNNFNLLWLQKIKLRSDILRKVKCFEETGVLFSTCVCVCVCVCVHKYEKTQGLQGMILFIV